MKNLHLHSYVILLLLTACLVTPSLPATMISHTALPRTAGSDDGNDTTPPVTSIILDGTVQGGVFITNVTVSFNASDDLSGVNATYFSFNAVNYTQYTTPILLSEPKEYTITYYSVDNAGNQEQEKNVTFTIIYIGPVKIDITGGIGPVITITNTGTKDLVNIPFSISMNNGYYIYGQYRNGTVSIPAGQTKTIRAFVLGLGEPTIIVNVGNNFAGMDAFIFGFLVIRL